MRVWCSAPGCGYSLTVRDEWDAQDALVSHHNVEHGRPCQGTWPAYDPGSVAPVLDRHHTGAYVPGQTPRRAHR